MGMVSISSADRAKIGPRFCSIIAAVVAIVGFVGGFAGTARAQYIPTIDIRATCTKAAAVTVSLTSGANDLEICMNSEDGARQQMIKNWSSFTPSDRQGCIQPQVYLPSYVEWLTCFEMNKVVREARERGQATQDVTKPDSDGFITLPRLGIRPRYYP
jgi:hypothetical protein